MFKLKCKQLKIDYDSLAKKLFTPHEREIGKLKWRKNVRSTSRLQEILNINSEKSKPFVEIYQSTVTEEDYFYKFLGIRTNGKSTLQQIASKALEKASESRSIFNVQLLIDWMSLDKSLNYDSWTYRINFPGSMNKTNWTLVKPYSLEEMQKLKINGMIKGINKLGCRI